MDGVIEYRKFSLFGCVPYGFATMDAVMAALVTILTERNTEVLEALFYVMGI